MGSLNEHVTGHSLPGMGPKISQTSEIVLTDPLHQIRRGVIIAASTDDPRAAFTGKPKLGAGLVLVRVEAAGPLQGKYVEFGHASSPGVATEKAVILTENVVMSSPADPSVKEDKGAAGLIHGFVDYTKIEWDGGEATVKPVLKLIEFEDLP